MGTEHAPAAGGGGTVQMDVMVVCPPNARDADGGAAASEALIDLFMFDANTAYDNWLIDMQLNLVYADLIDYDAGAEHLGALRGSNDGEMDEVHVLRYFH